MPEDGVNLQYSTISTNFVTNRYALIGNSIWHSASRGFSTVAEPLVLPTGMHCCHELYRRTDKSNWTGIRFAVPNQSIYRINLNQLLQALHLTLQTGLILCGTVCLAVYCLWQY